MFDPITLAVMALCAVLIGIAKTGLPTLGIAVAGLMALVMPAKMSIGLILPLLVVGDIFSVFYYRRHAQMALLRKLLPFVLIGMLIGTFVLKELTNEQVRPFLGALILLLIGLDQVRRMLAAESVQNKSYLAGPAGLMGGFCTIMGNAAGPVMALYFIFLRLPKQQLMGTVAWFFLSVNIIKVPVFFSIGMLSVDILPSIVWLVPLVLFGAYLGIKLLQGINQKLFEQLIVGLSIVAALWLLVGP